MQELPRESPEQLHATEVVEAGRYPSATPAAGGPRVEGDAGRARARVLLVLVLAVAALARFVGLGHPAEVYFDETYYANDAVVYLEGAQAFRYNLDPSYGGTSRETDTVPVGAVPGEISWVHPPLGKWGIALGILVFGKTPFGWRVVPAIFGTAAVGLVFALAWSLWRRASWAFLAAFLVAVDGLAITMSRIAMLDVFASTFALASFCFLLRERRRLSETKAIAGPSPPWSLAEGEKDGAWEYADTGPQRPRLPDLRQLAEGEKDGAWEYETPDGVWKHEVPQEGETGLRGSRIGTSKYLAWAGVFIGLALASKLSVVYAWGLLVAFSLAWAVQLRPAWMGRLEAIVTNLPRVILLLVLLPLAIYVLSFVRFYADNAAGSFVKDPLGTAVEFVRMQKNTAHYHLSMRQEHPYQSGPGSWPLMSRPIAFWYEDHGDGTRGHILAVGNPVLWWSWLLAAPALSGLVLARRRWQEVFVLAGYFGQYLPWFASSRTAFFYYMLPAVPFMAVGLVGVLGALPRASRKVAMVALGVGGGISGALFYPVWTGIPIPERFWDGLMLFRSWI